MYTLKELLVKLNVAQIDLAAKLGWGRDRVNRYVHGVRKMGPAEVSQIASALGVTVIIKDEVFVFQVKRHPKKRGAA